MTGLFQQIIDRPESWPRDYSDVTKRPELVTPHCVDAQNVVFGQAAPKSRTRNVGSNAVGSVISIVIATLVSTRMECGAFH